MIFLFAIITIELEEIEILAYAKNKPKVYNKKYWVVRNTTYINTYTYIHTPTYTYIHAHK